MTIEELHRKIDKEWPKHLEKTRKLLRIPSVSMTGEGIQECADFVEGMLEDIGAKHGQFKGTRSSHPLVHGHIDVGAERTALLYGMYDVQPVGNPDEWNHPPFGAKIVKMKPWGAVLVSRGVYNSKGALGGMLLAIKTMVDNDALPMNFHFLIEGEEELGGHSLPKWVFKHKPRLSRADVAFEFDYSENARGVPVISLGMKGCVYFDLVAEGKDRGGPEAEPHSSDAVIVESPAWRLVHALSTMVDKDQNPTIDGLSDDVQEASPEDRRLVKRLLERFDIDAYRRELGIQRFKATGSPEEIMMKYLYEPSVNINGLSSGFEEDGTKTVLPPRAKAKIDIRMVPNMTIEGTRKKVMEHLKRRGFTDIRMRNYIDYPWAKVSVNEVVSQASIEAMRFHGKEPEVWPMVAGSAPMYLFDQVLGVPWGGVGLGHGANAHSPNEYAVVKGMKDFEKSVCTVFWKYAELSDKRR